MEVPFGLIHAEGQVAERGHDRRCQAAPGRSDGSSKADLHAARAAGRA